MRYSSGWWLLAALVVGCSPNGGMEVTSPAKTATVPPVEKVTHLRPGPNAQQEVQTALIKAQPGDILEFAEGTFEFTMGLSLTVKNVTLRGKGMDKTILSFQQQNAGKEGLLVQGTVDGFRMEDMTVQDTKGDGVKINGADGVTLRRVRVRWTAGPRTENGGYGLYPVQCRNVLVEDCEASDASDAGIYVGQSRHAIVRRCKAEKNVTGIEIENTFDADVYENMVSNNTGGIMVFDLPGLDQKNGGRIRVFRNQVVANNHPNFAPKGTTVATVPPGTGLMVMAVDQVELFENEVRGHQTAGLAVVSYFITGNPLKDKDYDPYAEGILVTGNRFARNGTAPQGILGTLLKNWIGTPLPDILYDGVQNPAKQLDGQTPPALRLYVTGNGDARFANFHFPADADVAKLMLSKPRIDTDLQNYAGELPRLPAITLPQR